MRRFVVLGINSSAVKKHEQRKKHSMTDMMMMMMMTREYKCLQLFFKLGGGVRNGSNLNERD
jgi:hypothetical protein